MKHQLLKTFSKFALTGAIAGLALQASAWSVRQNGSYCMADPGAPVMHDGAGVSNYSTTAVGKLTCPVIDTSLTPKTGITALGVTIEDNSTTGSATAQACINYASLAGGNCGAAVSTSAAGTGLNTLSPARTFWGAGDANDYPYVLVILPAKTGSAPSFLTGYNFSG